MRLGSSYQKHIGLFFLSAMGILGACSGESENGTQGAGGSSSSSSSTTASSSSGGGGSCAASELCGDGLDNDCNGSADDGCLCVPGASQACYTGPPGTQDIGICKGGSQSCNPDGLGYGPCSNEQIPQAESCDAALLDEDCDGQLNEEGMDCACGDGYISSLIEACDDQNAQGGDGCSAACAIETGWTCVGNPSMCGTICGDGLIIGPETCDDGNTSDGDNCSSSCGLQLVEQVSLGLFYSCARLILLPHIVLLSFCPVNMQAPRTSWQPTNQNPRNRQPKGDDRIIEMPLWPHKRTNHRLSSIWPRGGKPASVQQQETHNRQARM